MSIFIVVFIHVGSSLFSMTLLISSCQINFAIPTTSFVLYSLYRFGLLFSPSLNLRYELFLQESCFLLAYLFTWKIFWSYTENGNVALGYRFSLCSDECVFRESDLEKTEGNIFLVDLFFYILFNTIKSISYLTVQLHYHLFTPLLVNSY